MPPLTFDVRPLLTAGASPWSPTVLRGRRLLALAMVVVASLLLSSCLVLHQGDGFAIGTETTRVNLVLFRNVTVLEDAVVHASGTSEARRQILAATPSSIHLSGSVMATICAVAGLLCLAAPTAARIVLSWWRSDVRNRSDFHEALHEGRAEDKCFAWTFAPSRNFTVKSRGTSGCR
jgi:hypothetical protein